MIRKAPTRRKTQKRMPNKVKAEPEMRQLD